MSRNQSALSRRGLFSPARTMHLLTGVIVLLGLFGLSIAIAPAVSVNAASGGCVAGQGPGCPRQLKPAQLAIQQLLAPTATTVTVDRTDDPAVSTAGSGAAACTAAANDCSLRGATLVVNADPGSTINIPAGTYQLTRDGSAEAGNCTDATIGDLDIAGNNTTITGAGAASTIIQQTMPHDRVICVDQFLAGNFTFSISGVTITGGRETFGVGGGGMISGAPGDVTNVTNVVFSNNQASGGGSPVGGGLANGAGGLNVSGSTFGGSLAPCASQTNVNCANQSAGSGGGIYYSNNNNANSLTLVLSNSTFINNVAGGNGGGLITTQASGTYNVSGSTFTNNTAQSLNGGGGGLFNESGTLSANTNTFTGNQATGAGASGNAIRSSDGGNANVTANFNRIVNNSGSSTDFYGGSGSTASITNNWWGCDGGPGAAGCDTVGGTGTNTFNPWIVLRTTASPSSVNYSDSTTLTTSFLQNSSGGGLTTGQIAVLIGLPVSWTSAAHGTLSNQQTSIQSNGTATATFTAGSTSADCGNVGKGEAVVDNVQSGDTTATASITINCPDLQASKTNNVSGSTTFGNSWTWTLTGSNSGPGQARYSNGQVILLDNLPNSNISYGTVTENNVSGVTGTISCSIDGSDNLSCTANGSVNINSSGSFTVQFTATPSAAGTVANPRSGGSCASDPNNNIPETSDGNNSCSNTVVVNRAATTTTLSSSGSPTVFGQAVFFTATVTSIPGIPTGSVQFYADGSTLGTPAILTSGSASVNTSALSVGTHVITGTYSGDTNYNPSTGTLSGGHTVNKAATTTTITSDLPDPSVVGQAVTVQYTVTVDAPGAGTPTGNVTVTDGINTCTGTVATGQCSITFTTAGSKSLHATYAGNASFNASPASTSVNHTVNPADTTTALTSQPNPSTLGQTVTFTATISVVAPGAGTPTGNVTFYDNGASIGTGSLAGGVATLSTSTLAVGTHPITATYSGDSNFNNSTSNQVNQVVNKLNTTTSLTSGPNPAVFGQLVAFTATVSSGAGTPTGSVTFYDNGISIGTSPLSGGVATFNTSALAVGTHPITATYSGDSNFNVSTSGTDSQVVNPASTSMALVSAPNASVFGQNVTFTATVSVVVPGAGTPTGNVTFFDNGISIGTGSLSGGVATLSTSSLAVGSHPITATYAGTTNFNGSTSNQVIQVVNPANTATTVTSDPNPSLPGQTAVFTATVTASVPGAGTPSGTVTFFDNGTSIGAGSLSGGVATFSTSSLAVGLHPITVTYAGSTSFNASTSNVYTHTVGHADTGTTLTSSTNPSIYGQPITLTATVTATFGTATGSVNFYDNGVLIGSGALNGSGVAVLNISTLAVGTHPITATYAGTAAFNGSTSNQVDQIVTQAGTSTVLVSSANPAVFGQSITFTATVSANAPSFGTPTGVVTFTEGAVVLGAGTLSGGVATFSTSSLSVGSHSITADYGGDGNFAGSTSNTVTQVVNQAGTSTIIVGTTSPAFVGQPITVTFSVNVTPPGSGTPTGVVTVTDGSATCVAALPATSCTLTFATPGAKNVTATYGGDVHFAGSVSSVTIINVQDVTITGLTAANSSPTILGNATFFTATISSGTNVVYTWNFGDGNTGSGTTPSHTYAAIGTYTATVTATNSSNTVVATTVATVFDTPITGLTATSDSPTRLGNATHFTATTTGGSGISYAWNFGDGNIGSGATPSHTYGAIGTYTATVTATNSLNSQTASTVVVVIDQPITGLTASNDSPTRLGSVTHFTATLSNGTNVTYQWNFGDGNIGSGAATSHTYGAIGSYVATVTATNGVSVVVATTNVSIIDTPIVNLVAANDSPTRLGSVTHFTATIGGGSNVTYQWNFGDGALGSGATASHVYGVIGAYVATVTATNGVSVVVATTNVSIIDRAIVGLSASNSSPTGLGNATIFTATISDGSNVTYQWNFGDGFTGSGAVTSHIYGAIGTYTATVTATNSVSVVVASTVATVVNQPVTGLSATNSSPTRLGSATSFTATITTGSSVSYAWNFGDGATGSGVNASHTYATVGAYTATVTATNSINSQTASTVVVVIDRAVVGLSASNDSPTRLGGTTHLSATISDGSNVTYQWNFGDGLLGSGATTSHVYGAVGSYVATVTATNGVSVVVATTNVSIIDTPIVGLTAANSSPTGLGLATVLTATISSGSNVTYAWNFGDGSMGSGATTTHVYPALGVYTSAVTATNGVSNVVATTLVTIVDRPLSNLIATSSSPTLLGNTSFFTATAVGSSITYNWNFGDGFTGSGANASHVYTATGLYMAIVTATNSIGSLTATVKVNVFSGKTYLPLIMRNYVSAPDLVVTSLKASTGNVQVVIKNQGSEAAVDSFYVDVYIDPHPAPVAVNQIWSDGRSEQGLVWGVTSDLQPGQALTLTIGDAYYLPLFSMFTGTLPIGTPVYAQVDSLDPLTSYGAVRENHEITGLPYNNILGPVSSTAALAPLGPELPLEQGDSPLPLRPEVQ